MEGELAELLSQKSWIEQKLGEKEVKYKSELNSFVKEADPKLMCLRKEIDTKREEFHKILMQIRENKAKKKRLLEELDLNEKISVKFKEFDLNKSKVHENKMASTKNIQKNYAKEKYYETFKEMKNDERFGRLNNFSSNLTNKTAPTVIFSPTNETNLRIARMLESDQKEMEEKFFQRLKKN